MILIKLINEHLNDNDYNFKNNSLFFKNKLNKWNGFCNNGKRRLNEFKTDINYDKDKDGMNEIIKFFNEEDCLFHLYLMEITIGFKNNFNGNNKCLINWNNQHHCHYNNLILIYISIYSYSIIKI